MWQWTEGSERFRSFPSVRFSFDQPKSISCITTSGGQGGYVSEFNLYNTGAESGNREFIQTIEVDTKDVTQQKTACLSSPLTTSDLIIMPTGGSKDFFMRFLIYQL
ncbi:Oidioi.mRNA.OKI2018_I69.XSR.g13482.t1.cds [Oikopleura dioica]|uniref:Oidioi.mRNA.OKI2018_I69.XSR.g13482.t1.cds n=1 Tax=Oikopleura dioica TaxID=34765 RepID=A0ABN7SBP9_OIKDI|nr:Oidioi.mRNA.OKI2018_I69.XSR.g13482.t1.cds [Oikopleura dioica]